MQIRCNGKRKNHFEHFCNPKSLRLIAYVESIAFMITLFMITFARKIYLIYYSGPYFFLHARFVY